MLAVAARLYAVPHVFAEVGNLTEMHGKEKARARVAPGHVISTFDERAIASRAAAQDRLYVRLGLTDAAIAVAAEEQKCAVLTDDLSLYVGLVERRIPAVNFTHMREQSWGTQ